MKQGHEMISSKRKITLVIQRILTLIFLLFYYFPGIGQQFNLVGSAAQLSCECYRLTDVAPTFQGGSVWNLNQVNLNVPFDYNFRVFLGCSNSPGADGICFVLQNTSVNVGGTGGGLGYMGFPNQSIGIELDTYQNTNYGDPVFDHVALQSNGSINHNLVAPVQASLSNQDIEDCAFHDFRILWDPASNNISVFFDGSLRFSYVFPGGLINSIFNGNSNVFWGFTGATGAETNLQQFCLNIDAAFSAGMNYAFCDPNNIPFVSNSQTGLNAISAYNWDFGDGNNSTLQNPVHSYAGSGNYNVTLTVTDQSGCSSTETHQIIISDPPAGIVTTTDVGCSSASDGTAELNLTSGSAPFTVTLPAGTLNAISPNLFQATGLAAGNYSFAVTDANGCAATISFQVNSTTGILMGQSYTDASCFGSADGTISVSPSGGLSPYTLFLNGIPQAGLSATNLSAGNYNIQVADANACSSAVQIVIAEPAQLVLNIAAIGDVQCNAQSNGFVQSSATGGSGLYTFTLGSIVSANGNFSGLPAGTYVLQVSDGNACATQQNITINEPQALVLNLVQAIDPICFGQNNGSIQVAAAGGTPAYQFQFGSQSNNTGFFSGLPSGNYQVTVNDNSSCSSTITISLSQPPPIIVDAAIVMNPICEDAANGMIQIQVSGGTINSSYQFSWNTNPPQNTQNVSNLQEGTYSVIVTDDVGCTAQNSWLLDAPSFFLLPVSDQQICEGNNMLVPATVLGGEFPYSFQWTDQGSGNIINSDTLSVLLSGSTSFVLQATDANGCMAGPVSFNATLLPTAIPSFVLSDTTGCAPLCLNFTGSSTLPDSKLFWLTGDGEAYADMTSFTHCYNYEGAYSPSIAAITAEGCTTQVRSDSLIVVLARPVADFEISKNSTNTFESKFNLRYVLQPQPHEQYRWDSSLPINWEGGLGWILLPDTGKYCVSLEVSNTPACIDTQTRCISSEIPFRLYIPSAFTPNEDGRNEVFLPSGGSYKEMDMRIFDRWGKVIYQENGTSPKGWSGQGFSQGSYVYVIRIIDKENNPAEYRGTVTLYR